MLTFHYLVAVMTSTEKKVDGEEIDNFNAIQDPNTLAALQEKLGQMTIKKPDLDELDLSPAVRKRVNAIKNIQLKTTKLEADFFKQVYISLFSMFLLNCRIVLLIGLWWHESLTILLRYYNMSVIQMIDR